METISIILVNYNSTEETVNCVKSLLNQDYPNISVIIVDNSEEKKYLDEIYKTLKEITPNIEITDENSSPKIKLNFNKDIILIKANENKGFSAGNNIGIRLALNNNADYIWILNNDTEVEKDTLTKMLNTSKRYEAPVITCKIKDFFNRNKVQYDGNAVFYGGRDDIFDKIKIPEVISGANLLIKSDIFQKIGLFDEDFFLYFEDNYLHYKLHKNKIPHLYTPYTHIYHKGGASIGNYFQNEISAYYGTRNSLLIIKKMKIYTKDVENYIRSFKEIKHNYYIFYKNKNILKAILLGVYDFFKGKIGRQDKLNFYLTLKPDKTEIENITNHEELIKQYPTNIKLNQILSEKYKNNPEKRLDYVFMLSILYPRKKEYYEEFFKIAEKLLTYQEETKNGKQSISMYNQN